MFEVVKENNNPEIQETFRFQHSPASKQPLLLQVHDDSDDDDQNNLPLRYIQRYIHTVFNIKFDFKVYDWDRFSKNDLMGEVKNILQSLK